jgi:hypothetical protein
MRDERGEMKEERGKRREEREARFVFGLFHRSR